MLSGSVGQGGVNRRDDTRTIQALLGDLQIAEGLPPLKVDGIVGLKTISAILAFQKQHPGLARDGRIDPNGPTLLKLDEKCANLYESIAYDQSSALLNQFQTSPAFHKLPVRATQRFHQIRNMLANFQPGTVSRVANRFGGSSVLQPFRTPLFGATLAETAALFILLFIFVVLLVRIVSNPIWQRAAREMVKGIKERIRLLSQAIRDAIKNTIDIIEQGIENSPCAGLCTEERANLKRIAEEINNLLDKMPANDNDPEDLKAKKFKLARLLEDFQKAQQSVIDCLARNGC
jgi:hypothetical protein